MLSAWMKINERERSEGQWDKIEAACWPSHLNPEMRTRISLGTEPSPLVCAVTSSVFQRCE